MHYSIFNEVLNPKGPHLREGPFLLATGVIMSYDEQSLLVLNEMAERVMGGDDWHVEPVRVTLPDGQEADVALKAYQPAGWERLVVQGLVRYDNRLVGERHAQRLAQSVEPVQEHTHEYGCSRSVFTRRGDGLFGPSGAGEYERDADRLLSLGVYMAQAILATSPECSVFAEGSKSLSLVRAMRGTGQDRLFEDLALRYAVDRVTHVAC